MKKIVSILMLSVISIAIDCNASALSYSDNIGLNFTFFPSLTVSLSSSDIVINDLTPGSSSDSNIVDINVVTNNINGYYLTSTVGNNVDIGSSDVNPNSTNSSNNNLIHNTTNLVHSNGVNTFASLATNDSIADIASFNDNQWGYNYSIDNQSTWSNYSGLPLYSDTEHVAILSNKYLPSNDTINFKIGAKASISQASGEYTNTINFIITAYPHPMSLADSYAYFNKQQAGGYYTMQDMEPGICAVADENSELTVIDFRDNNTYTIAKLADGRCWMTTNLNLEGGTQLSYEDTDMPEGYILPVANGFQEGNRLPESSIEGFNDNNIAYLYNSHRNTLEDCSTAPGCYSYYSWTTATVGSGVGVSTTYTRIPYSVCPANWKLPTAYDKRSIPSDFPNLIVSYGGSNTNFIYDASTVPTGKTIYENIKSQTLPNLIMAGGYNASYNPTFRTGGYYWASNTNSSANNAAFFYFYSTHINSANNAARKWGFPVRCIADQ